MTSCSLCCIDIFNGILNSTYLVRSASLNDALSMRYIRDPQLSRSTQSPSYAPVSLMPGTCNVCSIAVIASTRICLLHYALDSPAALNMQTCVLRLGKVRTNRRGHITFNRLISMHLLQLISSKLISNSSTLELISNQSSSAT